LRRKGFEAMNEPVEVYAQAIAALNRGEWQKAQSLAMGLLKQAPHHAGVHFVAGAAALQLGQMPLAAELSRRAVSLNPKRADYAAQLARVLATGRFIREAVEVADKAMTLVPGDPLTLDTLGVVYTQANEHGKAIEVFQRAAALMPDRASYRFNLATSLTFSGRIDEAEREHQSCLQLDPRYWKAYLALSQLRRQTESSNHVSWFESVLPSAEHNTDALMYLHLALAKEYEDLGRYELAFEHLTKGKSANRASRDYSTERDNALFKALAEAPLAPPGAGSESREPIFVIGMPRSGTTLVERILSSHPQVHSAGELQNFGVMLKRATGSRTPHMLDMDTVARSKDIVWRQLGDAYVASTRPGTGHTPYFIDKLPHNFLYAGFIASALPNAKIICLRRNAMDTCLSNFRQLFAQTSPYYDYSFDLMDTGRYYLLFEQLMVHWRQAIPGRILEIDYESIVDDQEGSTRRLLDFCGLPWDDACMRFQDNQAPVATASATQVRAPIYRSALQRWKRYETQLGGLRELLENAGIAV
jgi:tetratricopeptide (TPR) repeat protein